MFPNAAGSISEAYDISNIIYIEVSGYRAITEEYGPADTPYEIDEARYHTSSDIYASLKNNSKIHDLWYVNFGTERDPDLWVIEAEAWNLIMYGDFGKVLDTSNKIYIHLSKTSFEAYESTYGFPLQTVNYLSESK